MKIITKITHFIALTLFSASLQGMGMHSMSLGGQGPSGDHMPDLELPPAKRQRVGAAPLVEVKTVAAETKAAAATLQAQDKPAAKGPFKLDKLPADLQSTICEYSMNPWDFCEALVIDEVVAAAPELVKKTAAQQTQEVVSLTPTLFVHVITTRDTKTDVYVWSIIDDTTLNCVNSFQLNYSKDVTFSGTNLVCLLRSNESEPWYFEIWDALKNKPTSQYPLQPGEKVMCSNHRNDDTITVITQKRFFILDVRDAEHPHIEQEKNHDAVIDEDDTIISLTNGGFVQKRHRTEELHAYDENFTSIKPFDTNKEPLGHVMQISDTELLTFYDSEPGHVRIWDLRSLTRVQEIYTETPEDAGLHILSNEAFALDNASSKDSLIYTKNKKSNQYELLKTKLPSDRTLNITHEIASKHFSILSYEPRFAVITIMHDRVKICPLRTQSSDCKIVWMDERDKNSFVAVDDTQRVHFFKIKKESLNELYKLNPAQQQILSAVIQRLHRAKDMPRESLDDINTHARVMCVNHDLLGKLPDTIRINVMNYFDIQEKDWLYYLLVKKEADRADSSYARTHAQNVVPFSGCNMPYTQSEIEAELEEIYSSPYQN